ncbi:MAG: hypothetical protein AAF517_24845 [Planctomycetota bacterium]
MTETKNKSKNQPGQSQQDKAALNQQIEVAAGAAREAAKRNWKIAAGALIVFLAVVGLVQIMNEVAESSELSHHEALYEVTGSPLARDFEIEADYEKIKQVVDGAAGTAAETVVATGAVDYLFARHANCLNQKRREENTAEREEETVATKTKEAEAKPAEDADEEAKKKAEADAKLAADAAKVAADNAKAARDKAKKAGDEATRVAACIGEIVQAVKGRGENAWAGEVERRVTALKNPAWESKSKAQYQLKAPKAK